MFSKIRWMVVVPAIAVAMFGMLVSSAGAANRFTGAIYTSNFEGTIVNQNHYKVKEAVYLNGGPQHLKGPVVPAGRYYFQVTDPSGRELLSSDLARCRQVVVGASGKVVGVVPEKDLLNQDCQHGLGGNGVPGVPSPNGTTPVQLFPYTNSRNGTYKVWLIAQSSAVTGCNPTVASDLKRLTFPGGCAKTDNYKVDSQTQPFCAAWSDEFTGDSLDPTRWEPPVTGPAPGGAEQVSSTFDPGNVSVGNGLLTLKLDQGILPEGLIISSGALVRTLAPCGYGTYEWTMRMGSETNGPSSTGFNRSGGVSAGLTFWNDSENEIVFEHSAHTGLPPSTAPESIWFVNFHNLDPANRGPIECESQNPPVPTNCEGTVTEHGLLPPGNVYSQFHHYKFVWEPGSIKFYIDPDPLDPDPDPNPKAVHTTNVPVVPGLFLISYFGRNFADWGGLATPGERFFYVDRVSYTPLP